MRSELSPAARAAALLQQPLPGGGAAMVAVEGRGKIPRYGCGQPEPERAKPPLPGAHQDPETRRKAGRSRGREGHHYSMFFSMPVATGPAAMKGSCVSGEVRYKGSARKRAGVRWSASGSGSAVGNGAPPVPAPAEPDRPDILSTPRHSITFSLSHAFGVSPTGSALGASPCAPPRPAPAAPGFARRIRPADAHRGGGRRSSARSLSGDRRL
jgi:hypothetical protein